MQFVQNIHVVNPVQFRPLRIKASELAEAAMPPASTGLITER